MAVFGDLAFELKALTANAVEKAQQEQFLQSLHAHPAETWDLVDIISKWGDHAPTLPPGAILGLAHAGIGPEHPVGQSVIRNGVPALSQPPGALDRAIAAVTPDELTSAPAASIGAMGPADSYGPDIAPPDYKGDPNDGGSLGPFNPVRDVLRSAADSAVSGAVSGAQFLGKEIARSHPISATSTPGGVFTPLGGTAEQLPNNQAATAIPTADALKATAREVGAIGNTGLQLTTVPLKLAAAATNEYIRHNPAGSTYSVPFTGAHFTVGSVSDALNPDQLTLVQQAHGKSLGTGYFPAGPASAAATAAQQRAGEINGHALTYGRVLASTVFEPGSRPYQAMSGTVDAGVALELDPFANALKFGSEARAANKLFAAIDDRTATNVAQYLVDNAHTSDAMTGLHAWAGSPETDLVGSIADKIKDDPGSALNVAQRLAIGDGKGLMRSAVLHKAGTFTGLRPFVHPPTAIQWMASHSGSKTIEALADETSFSKIRSLVGDTVPVDLVARLAHADTPELVRAELSSELGPTVDGPFGYRWWRGPEQTRLFGQMPKDSIDLTDGNQMVQQAERTFGMVKLPTAKADPILEEIAGARTLGGAAKAYFKVGDAVADHMINLDPKLVEAVRATDDPAAIRALVGKKFTQEQIDRLASTVNENTVKQILGTKLGDVPPDLARKLTHFFQNEWRQQHKFAIDEVGQPIRAAGVVADGEGVPLMGPHMEAELARFLPPLDPRQLRQATSKPRQLLHFWNDEYLTDPNTFEGGVARRLHQAASVESAISGKVTGLFKVGVLSAPRVALRVTGEEQLASAVAGVDSLFNHPIQYIGTALGGRVGQPTSKLGELVEGAASAAGKVVGERAALNPLTGRKFVDELSENGSNFLKAMGSANAHNPSEWTLDRQALKAYVDFSKQDHAYLRSWADEISLLHKDALHREVARALLDPTHVPAGAEESGLQGIDAVKEWYSNGGGQRSLANLRDADLRWGSRYLNNRSVADGYVDSAVKRVMVKTGGDPTLLDAAANGRGFNFTRANQGIQKSVSHDLRVYLKEHIDDLGPDVVKGRPPLSAMEKRRFDHAVDWWMNKLMDAPSRILTKSPFYRQWAYKETQRLMPYLTPEAQDFVIENAAKDGMEKAITKPSMAGLLDAEHADTIVKARTLARMKDYLYYPGDKTTAEDILRNVSPFAPAWKSVVKRWSKLALEHPQVIRRAQQGVQEMQTSGFTYKDPQSGKEMFSIAGPGWVKNLTGAVGFDLQAPIQGVNILGNGLPGVGLGPQIAAGAVIPKNGMTAGLRNFISPYGPPDMGNAVEPFFPGWLQKAQAGGFQGIPFISGALRTLLPRTPQQTVTIQDLQKQALDTMVNSNQYDLTKPGVLDQLEQRAKSQANRLYMLASLAQFVSPTAPSFAAKIAPPGYPQGLFLYKITKDFHDTLAKNHGDFQKTTEQFVAKYGPNVIFATEPQNYRTVYGVPTSVQGEVWQNQHDQFARRFPNVWGYFAPQGGAFSQTVYRDEIKKGLIQPLKVEEWGAQVESTLGSFIYDQLRKQFGGHVTHADQTWLDEQKVKIAKEHPGYTTNIPGVGGRAKPAQIVEELGRAIQDPAIAQTPVARAVSIYLDLRQQALTAAGRKTLTGTNMAASRAWLYEQGNALVQQYPELSPIWDSLFQREVVPQ